MQKTIQQTLQCSEGCLQCVLDNQGFPICKVCDSFMGYIKIGTQCEQNTVMNCLISFERNQCYQCKHGYFLSGDLKCIAISEQKQIKIKSCNVYGKPDDCIACDLMTYKKNGICNIVEEQVDQCTLNKSIHACEICDFKLPSYNQTYCNEIENYDENCFLYTHPLSCRKCKDGFKKNENYFMKTLDTIYQTLFVKIKFWREFYYDIVYDAPVCELDYEIENCEILGQDNTCEQCKAGYTLSPDKTICFIKPVPPQNPQNKIPNCYLFTGSNYEKCKICLEGYFLTENNTKCKIHSSTIDNCLVRSQTRDGVCAYCSNKFYLTENNDIQTCTQRISFFPNCKTYKRLSDECIECLPGHTFHNNQNSCSLLITNCQTHNTQEGILKCDKCDDGYYLENFQTECVFANNSVDGCVEYQDAISCLKCTQGYYLYNNKCFIHNKYFQCEVFSITQQDTCDKCIQEGAKSVIVSECTPLQDRDLIQNPNCELFDENKVCKKCQFPYVVEVKESSVLCKEFPGCAELETTIVNGKELSTNICKKCDNGYYLYFNKCIFVGSVNCLYTFSQNTTDGAKAYSFEGLNPCQLCNRQKYFAIAESAEKIYKCISRQESQMSPLQCLQYTINETGFVCMECMRGYYLDNGLCVEHTDISTRIITADYTQALIYDNNDSQFDSFQWTQSSDTAIDINTKCLQASQDLSGCLRCKDNYTAMYTSTSMNAFLAKGKDTSQLYKFKNYVSDDSVTDKLIREQYITLDNLLVDYCHNYSGSIFQFKSQLTIDNNIKQYVCTKGVQKINQSDTTPIKNHNALTLTYTKGTATPNTIYQTYWESNDLTQRKPLCDNSPTDSIPNCSLYSNQVKLEQDFISRYYLSCVECENNYQLVVKNWDVTLQVDKFANKTWNENKFEWIQTDCLSQSEFTFQKDYVANCQYYTTKSINNALVHLCQACTPGYKDLVGQLKHRCPPGVEYYDPTTEDRCQNNFFCNEWSYCERICSNPCDATQYCNLQGVCMLKCDGSCLADEYCDLQGGCNKKCDCLLESDQFQYKCDATTNYMCVPLLCENAIDETIEDRLITRAEFLNNLDIKQANHTYIRVNDDNSVQILYPDQSVPYLNDQNVESTNYSPLTAEWDKIVESFFLDGFYYKYDNINQKILTVKFVDTFGKYNITYNLEGSDYKYNLTEYFDVSNNLNHTRIDYDNGTYMYDYSDKDIFYYNNGDNRTTFNNDGTIYSEELSTNTIKNVAVNGIATIQHYNGTQETAQNGLRTLVPSDTTEIQKIEIYYATPNIQKIFYTNETVKTINVDDNSGTIIYNASNDPKTSTTFTSTSNTTTYDDNSEALYTVGDNFDKYYLTSGATAFTKRYFNVTATLTPNLRNDITNLQMEKHEIYNDGININHIEEYYYNADPPHELIATKHIYGDNYYTDFAVINQVNQHDRLISNTTHYSYVYNNSTRKIELKSDSSYILYHQDGSRFQYKADGTKIETTIEEQSTTYNLDGSIKIEDAIGQITTIAIDKTAIKTDQIDRREGMPNDFKFILEDGAVYETDNNFYYKLSYANGDIKFKKKVLPYEKVFKQSSGECTSDDVLNFETFKVNGIDYQYDPYQLLLKSKDGSNAVVVTNPLQFTTTQTLLDKGCQSTSMPVATIYPSNPNPGQARRLQEIVQSPDPWVDTGSSPQVIRTYTNGVQVEWPNKATNEIERTITLTNSTTIQFLDISQKKRIDKDNSNTLIQQWNFNTGTLQYERNGQTIQTMTESVYNIDGNPVGKKYDYIDQGDNMSYIRYTNGTEEVINQDKYIINKINTNNEILTTELSKQILRLNNGTTLEQPFNMTWSMKYGTVERINDLATKIITETDTSTSPQTVTQIYPDGQRIITQGSNIQYYFTNHTEGINDGTTLTLNFYDVMLPMFEKYKTEVYDISTGAYTETYINKYEIKDTVQHYANGNIETTFRNNTIKLEYDTDKIKYTYGSNDYIIYQNNAIIEQSVNDGGGTPLIYTLNALKDFFERTDGTYTYRKIGDGSILKFPTATIFPSILTNIDNRIEEHSEYSKADIYFKDKKSLYNLIIDGVNQKVVLPDIGTINLTDLYISIERNDGTFYYDKIDCRKRIVYKKFSTFQMCVRHEFPNGDVGFYYSEESLILKANNDIWYKTQDLDYFLVINWETPIYKIFKSGEVLQENNGRDDAMQMESHMYYMLYSNSTFLEIDYKQNLKNYYKNLNEANQIQETFYQNGLYQKQENLPVTKNTVEFPNKDTLVKDTTQEVYTRYQNYTLTKTLSTGDITKEYYYHPFIQNEIISGGIKKINFKDRFAKFRNMKILELDNSGLLKRTDYNNNVWTINADGTETFNNKVYDINTGFITTTIEDNTSTPQTKQITIEKSDYTEIQYYDDSVTPGTFGLLRTEKIYNDRKETLIGNELTILYGNGLQVVYPDQNNLEIRTISKPSDSSYRIWQYDSATVKNFNPHLDYIQQVDWNAEQIYYDRAAAYAAGKIETNQHPVTIDGATSTLYGTITAPDTSSSTNLSVNMGISGTTTMTTAQVDLTPSNNAVLTANDYITFTGGTITWNNGNNQVASPTGNYFIKNVSFEDTNNTYTITQTALATLINYNTATFTEGTFAVTNSNDKYFSAINANVQTQIQLSATNAKMDAYKGNGVATLDSAKTGSVTDGTITIVETSGSALDVSISNANGNISMLGDINLSNAATIQTTSDIIITGGKIVKTGGTNTFTGSALQVTPTDAKLLGSIQTDGNVQATSATVTITDVAVDYQVTELIIEGMTHNILGDISCPSVATFQPSTSAVFTGEDSTVTLATNASGTVVPGSIILTAADVEINGGVINVTVGTTVDNLNGTYTITGTVVTIDTFSNIKIKTGVTSGLNINDLTLTGGTLAVTSSNNASVMNGLTLDSETCTFDHMYSQGTAYSGGKVTATVSDYSFTQSSTTVLTGNSNYVYSTGKATANINVTSATAGQEPTISGTTTSSDTITMDCTTGCLVTSATYNGVSQFTLSASNKITTVAVSATINLTLASSLTYTETAPNTNATTYTTANADSTIITANTNTGSVTVTPTTPIDPVIHTNDKLTTPQWTQGTLPTSVTLANVNIKSKSGETYTYTNLAVDQVDITSGTHTSDSTKQMKVVLEASDPTYGAYYGVTATSLAPTDFECATENINLSTTQIDITTVVSCTQKTGATNISLTIPSTSTLLFGTGQLQTVDNTNTITSQTQDILLNVGTAQINYQGMEVYLNTTDTLTVDAPATIKTTGQNIHLQPTTSVTTAITGAVTTLNTITTATAQTQLTLTDTTGNYILSSGTLVSTGGTVTITEGTSTIGSDVTNDTITSLSITYNSATITGGAVQATITGGTTTYTSGNIVLVNATQMTLNNYVFVTSSGLVVMDGGNTTYDPASISSDPLPVTTEVLSQPSDTFVKLKRLSHIFTLHDNHKEEYDNLNDDYSYIYYLNTTHTKKYRNGTLDMTINNGTHWYKTDYNFIINKDASNTIVYTDDLIAEQITDSSGVVKEYDGSVYTNVAGNDVYTFNNGTIVTKSATDIVTQYNTTTTVTETLANKDYKVQYSTNLLNIKEWFFERYKYTKINQDDSKLELMSDGTYQFTDGANTQIENLNFELIDTQGTTVTTYYPFTQEVKVDNAGSVTYTNIYGENYTEAAGVITLTRSDGGVDVYDPLLTKSVITFAASGNVIEKFDNGKIIVTYTNSDLLNSVQKDGDNFEFTKDTKIYKFNYGDNTLIINDNGVDGTPITCTLTIQTQFNFKDLTCDKIKMRNAFNYARIDIEGDVYGVYLNSSNALVSLKNNIASAKLYFSDNTNTQFQNGKLYLQDFEIDHILDLKRQYKLADNIIEESYLKEINPKFKRIIKSDLKTDFLYKEYNLKVIYNEDYSRTQTLQSGSILDHMFTYKDKVTYTNTYFVETDLLLNTQWQYGRDYPKKQNLEYSQSIDLISDTEQRRLFWLESQHKLYQSWLTSTDSIYNNYYRDYYKLLGTTKVGYKNIISNMATVWDLSSMDQTTITNIDTYTCSFANFLKREFIGQNGSTYIGNVLNQSTGTITDLILLDGTRLYSDSADSTTDYIIEEGQMKKVISGTDIIYTSQNSQYQMTIDQTGQGSVTFDGFGVTLSVTNGIETYTMPSTISGYLNLQDYTPELQQVVWDKPNKHIQFRMSSSDVVEFNYDNSDQPQSIEGNTWNYQNGYYTMNLNLNSIVKNIAFKKIDDNHIYFSYDSIDINETNQLKFNIFLKEPIWNSYNIADTNIFKHYYLNGTILETNESNANNKTYEYFFKDSTSTMYGPDFYTNKDSTTELTRYYNDNVRSKSKDLVNKQVVYTEPTYVKTDQYDATWTTLEETVYTYNSGNVNDIQVDTINHLTNIQTQTFFDATNTTIKTINQNTNNIKWLYDNGSYLEKLPTEDGDVWKLTETATKIYTTYPDGKLVIEDGTTKTEIITTTNYIQTKVYENQAPQTTTKQYNAGPQIGQTEVLDHNTSNTTITYPNNDVKIINQFNSYVINRADDGRVMYAKEEKYFSLDEVNLPAGEILNTYKYFYNNGDTALLNGDNNILTYTYLNNTIREENYPLTYKEFTYPVDQYFFKNVKYEYHNNGKMKQITRTKQNDDVIVEQYFANEGDSDIMYQIEMTYADTTKGQTIVSNTTDVFTRVTTFPNINNNSTEFHTSINGVLLRRNLVIGRNFVVEEEEDQFRYMTRTFTNGTTVTVDPDEFIMTGCWYNDLVCARQKCYKDIKCNCNMGEYCEWNTSTQSHQCIPNQPECNECKTWNKYCQKKTDDGTYYICIDQKQENTLSVDNTCQPSCAENEVCINGECNFKGVPCSFYDAEKKVAIFCGKDEVCLSNKCYKNCQPPCLQKETCVIDETKNVHEAAKCVIKPGNAVLSAITSCTEISNCQESEHFNKCDRCENNYSLFRDLSTTFTSQRCVKTNIENCMIGIYDTNAQAYVCDPNDKPVEAEPYTAGLQKKYVSILDKGCHYGFTYENGYCVERTPFCKDYYKGQCRYCSTKYENELKYSVYADYSSGECVDIPDIASDFPSYIPAKEEVFYCEYFAYYFPIKTNQRPIDSLSVGGNQCEMCQTGYYLNDFNHCIIKGIVGCEEYDTTIPYQTPQIFSCLKCEIGYTFISNTECKLNTPTDPTRLIPKCIKYDTDESCRVCDSGYVSLEVTNPNGIGQKRFCFQITNEPDCNEMDIEFFQGDNFELVNNVWTNQPNEIRGQVKCKQCKDNANSMQYPMLLPQNDIVKSCIYIPAVPSCIEHDKGSAILEGTYRCTKCHALYYLNTVTFDDQTTTITCAKRTYFNVNCEIYKIDADECEKEYEVVNTSTGDQENVSQDLQELLKTPPPSELEIQEERINGWIMGCAIYSDSKTCSKCYAPKFINVNGFEYNNKCIEVDVIIPHCKFYDLNQECEECENFYLLRDKKCYLKTVENCYEYIDENQCRSCPIEYPLLDEEGNCTKHPLNPWCKIYNIQQGKELNVEEYVDCNICEEGFYPDSFSFCRIAQNVILNCKYYLGDKLCLECEPGFYLKYNGKKCETNPQYDRNCEEFEYRSQCSVCAFGHYLQDGICVQCENLPEGCGYCDPFDNSKCALCRFGFTMDSEGNCKETAQGSGSVTYITNFLIKERTKLEQGIDSKKNAVDNWSVKINTLIWMFLLILI